MAEKIIKLVTGLTPNSEIHFYSVFVLLLFQHLLGHYPEPLLPHNYHEVAFL